MAWEGSDRLERLPADWPKRRALVLGRDGYACTWIRTDTGTPCGAYATDVDHIIPGDDHELTNLRALCKFHHQRKSSHEGGVARAATRPNRSRPGESHPGSQAVEQAA